jgi:hypothetical protein
LTNLLQSGETTWDMYEATDDAGESAGRDAACRT